MRQIGQLSDEPLARRFVDYLLTQGMKADVEEQGDDWAVWIMDEDHVDDAKRELAEFQRDSDNSRYAAATQQATTLRQQSVKNEREIRKRVVNLKDRWERPAAMSFPVTLGMIGVSVIVFFFTNFTDKAAAVLTQLLIEPGMFHGLEAVRQGEVWRLVTPIFVHFGFLHILFDMIMLFQLGAPVELRRGSFRYVLIVLAIALTSNLGQYYWAGPAFGGMSGVVYGLFGYIWMKSRFEPSAGLYMPQNVVLWLMAWYFLCMFDVIKHVANAAHTAGLVAGIVIGLAPFVWSRLLRP